MLNARWGRIVNVSSVVAERANPGQANYVASKAGLLAFTGTVAREMARKGITCNAVTPGVVETDMTADIGGRSPAARAGRPRRAARGGRRRRRLPLFGGGGIRERGHARRRRRAGRMTKEQNDMNEEQVLQLVRDKLDEIKVEGAAGAPRWTPPGRSSTSTRSTSSSSSRRSRTSTSIQIDDEQLKPIQDGRRRRAPGELGAKGAETAASRDVVVTGRGVVSSIGEGADAFFDALLERRSGMSDGLGACDGVRPRGRDDAQGGAPGRPLHAVRRGRRRPGGGRGGAARQASSPSASAWSWAPASAGWMTLEREVRDVHRARRPRGLAAVRADDDAQRRRRP